MCKQWFNEELIEMKASLETTNGYHEAVWSDTRTQKAVKLIYEEEAYSMQTYFAFMLADFYNYFNTHKGTNYQAFNQKQVVEDYLASQSFDNNLEEKFFKDIDEVGDIYLWENVVNEVFYSSKHQLRYLNDGLRANYTRDPEISLHKTIENVTGVVAGSLSWFGPSA